MHLWRYYSRSMILAMKAYSSYRTNFWLGMVGIAALYGTQFAVLLTTLAYFKSINGWDIYETGLLYGFWVLTYGIMIFFFPGIRDFAFIIHNGDFDTYKTRPMPLMFQVLCGRHEMNAWAHTTIGAASLVYFFGKIGLDWNITVVLRLLSLIAGGVLVQGAVLLLWAALSFYFIQTNAFSYITWNINAGFLVYPLSIYPKIIGLLFTVFPMAFISYYPTAWLLGKDGDNQWVELLGMNTFVVGLIFFILVFAFWNLSARYFYKSTGN